MYKDFDLTPNWKNFYLFLMDVKENDRVSYQRMVKKDEAGVKILLKMAKKEGWDKIAANQ